MIIAFIVAVIAIIADILSKWAVVEHIKPVGSVTLIEGILDFTYVENRGMAFGMLSGHRWVFMVFTVVLLIAIAAFLYYYRESAGLWLKISCGLVMGGGVGNMIDRVSLGYVVDFIDFCAFDFWVWVFNVADACVCVGVFMLAVYLIMDTVRTEREKKQKLSTQSSKEADE